MILLLIKWKNYNLAKSQSIVINTFIKLIA